jgi:hypothetical protein
MYLLPESAGVVPHGFKMAVVVFGLVDSDELKAEDPTSDQPEGGEEEGAEADERRRTRRGGPPQHTIEWINSRKAHAKKLQKHFEENALVRRSAYTKYLNPATPHCTWSHTLRCDESSCR